MNTGERRGNAGPWKTKENQNQVSLRFPPPLEIASDFHIPTAPMTSLPSDPKPNRKPKERSPAWPHTHFTLSGSSFD